MPAYESMELPEIVTRLAIAAEALYAVSRVGPRKLRLAYIDVSDQAGTTIAYFVAGLQPIVFEEQVCRGCGRIQDDLDEEGGTWASDQLCSACAPSEEG